MPELLDRLRPLLGPLTYLSLATPLAFAAAFLVGVRQGGGAAFAALLVLFGLLLLVVLSLAHLYAAYAWSSPHLSTPAKAGWTVAMLVLGPPALVAYWRLHLRAAESPPVGADC